MAMLAMRGVFKTFFPGTPDEVRALRGLDLSIEPGTFVVLVVGVNGSQAAVNAAKWAIDEALSRQVPLRLVYVIPRREAQNAGAQTSEWELERAEMALSQADCAVQSEGKSVQVEWAILAGDPEQVLVKEAQEAALVCVGTARRGWAADGLLGPTAAAFTFRQFFEPKSLAAR